MMNAISLRDLSMAVVLVICAAACGAGAAGPLDQVGEASESTSPTAGTADGGSSPDGVEGTSHDGAHHYFNAKVGGDPRTH